MMASFQPMPEYAAVGVEDRSLRTGDRDINVRVYTPPQAQDVSTLIVFFHGGGWVVGTLDTHDPYSRALCHESSAVVVSVDYRLAPEHKFPAAVEDALASTEYVLAHAKEFGANVSRIFLAGDSAGATLATVTCILLRDKGVGGIAGQVLLYPAVNHYSQPTQSYTDNAAGYGLTRDAMIWFWDHYLNDPSEAADLRAAPINAPSLTNLPKAFILTAEYDILRDEGQAYAKRLRESDVDVTQVCVKGMNHSFAAAANVFPHLPQAKDALHQVAAWINAIR